MGKITREEYESNKKSVHDDILKINRDIGNNKKDTEGKFGRFHVEMEKVNNRFEKARSELETQVKRLQTELETLRPQVVTVRQKDMVILRMSKEMEEQTVRNVELRTRANTLIKDNNRLKAEVEELSKKKSLRDKKRN